MNEDPRPSDPALSLRASSPIVELRRYTLHPGQRDVLIELFDREFIESQEELGMEVIGQFRDLDDPDAFVWLRGFSDMSARARGLAAFYSDGPVWAKHRDAANATMIDSSDVLLLRPARPTSGFSLGHEERPPRGATQLPRGMLAATICHLDAPADSGFLEFFERALAPLLADAGAPARAMFVTEESPNNFPGLPIREGEHVFVWFSRFPDRAAYERHAAALAGSPRWAGALASRLQRAPEVLRLSPTARSRLHG